MKYWRLLVKNKDMRKQVVFAAFVLAVMCVSMMVGCKEDPVVEYRKYANDADVPRISAADAKKDVDAGIAVIVDSRGDAAFLAEHIKGSISVPSAAMVKERLSEIPKGKKIIVYCS